MREIIKNDRLNESYIKYQHKSGLTILMYPLEGYSAAYALFGTKFGSIDTEFTDVSTGETVKIPDGTAHFLEHKMFESEQGDAFELFAKTGASANAFTSFDRTCYLFSTSDNFEQSVRSLLDFVTTPYFTPETVLKEQGIIGQEIRMYDDNPGWRVYFNLLSTLYQNHPVRTDIAGTVESIAEIDDKILYSIYNKFYNLHNMVLAVTGNFDPDVVIKAADDILKEAQPCSIERIHPNEPSKPLSDHISQQLEVSVPLFCIGFKEHPAAGKQLLKNELMSELISELIFGEGGDLYRSLYDEGLINSAFGTEVVSGRGYFAEVLEGESKNPEEVFLRVKAAVEDFKRCGISEQQFNRVKKLIYGRNVRQFNNIENIASTLVNSHFSDVCIYDIIEITAGLTVNDVNEYLKKTFNIDNSALSVILPKH